MKFVKNVTSFDIFITELGFNIPAGYNHEISLAEIFMWQYSQELVSKILDLSIVVNDGITFYTDPNQGIAYLKE